jgi:hypothetical protein
MGWVKSILDVVANVFGFITEFFKRKNEKDIKLRKEQKIDSKFKNIAKDAIKNKDIKKIRDLLSE